MIGFEAVENLKLEMKNQTQTIFNEIQAGKKRISEQKTTFKALEERIKKVKLFHCLFQHLKGKD